MKVIYAARRAGKTTRAIRECVKKGYVLVVPNLTMKVNAIERGLPEDQVITHREFLRGGLRLWGARHSGKNGMAELIIDDADLLLNQLAQGFPIRRVTISKDFTKAQRIRLGLE